MGDEDEDYMADLNRFIPAEFAFPSQVQNGKPQGEDKEKQHWKEKRKMKQEQRKKAEETQRNEGLGSAIPSTNIGFKMLQQMGYTPGAALGKHGQGVLEPVNVDLKRGRTGLGRDSAVKEEQIVKAKRAEFDNVRKSQMEKELRADFQERRRGTWQSRKIATEYGKACATLAQLEEGSASSSGPKQKEKDKKCTQECEVSKVGADTVEDKADEEEEEITAEALQEILQKLRREYNYCLYCGFKYDSAEALVADCPGIEDESH